MISPKQLASALRKGRQTRYGRWVTIGAKDTEEEGKKGGTHVYIGDGGKITRGPSALEGKSPDQLASGLKNKSASSSANPQKAQPKTQLAPWSQKSPDQLAGELRSNRGKTQLAPKEAPKTQLKPEAPKDAPKTEQPQAKAPEKKPETPKAPEKATTPSTSPAEPKKAMASPDELAMSLKPSGEPEAPSQQAYTEEGKRYFESLSVGKSGYPKSVENAVKRALPYTKPGTPDFDDALQAGAMAVIDAASRGKIQGGGEDLPFTVAKNAILSQGRAKIAQKRGGGQVKQIGEDFTAPAKVTGPQEQASTDAQSDVQQALAKISNPTQRALLQGVMDGKSIRQMAEEFGMPASTLNHELTRAKEVLKERLGGSEVYQRIEEELTRYEYGPRHSPPKRLEGAVARLEALADYAEEIAEEDLEMEIEGIAREFSAEDLKEIAKKFGIRKGLATKAQTVEKLLAKVSDKERHEKSEIKGLYGKTEDELVSILDAFLTSKK